MEGVSATYLLTQNLTHTLQLQLQTNNKLRTLQLQLEILGWLCDCSHTAATNTGMVLLSELQAIARSG